MDASILGFGGAEIGFERADQERVTTLLGEALDAGLNVIDTAECYANSEELIGRAVSHRRDDYWLFTKVGHEQGWGAGEDWSGSSITRSIDRSLRRLRTDRVDLVQLHSCGVGVLRKGEAIEALQRARDAGKSRFIGYSGDSDAALEAVGTGAFDTLQISISIADQESIDRVLPEAQARDLGVIAKRPIANAAWRYGQTCDNSYHETYWKRLSELRYDFATPGLAGDAAAEAALRFTLSVRGVHTAIVGTKAPGRWQKNAALVALGPLEPGRFEAIRRRWSEAATQDWVGQV